MSESFESQPKKKKRNAYVTGLQKEKLIDFVASNYGVLYGNDKCEDGNTTKDDLWNKITTELNELGAEKDKSGWKRCYASLKCSTIRKVKNSADEGLNSSEMKIVRASQSNPRIPLAPKNTISGDQRKADGTYSTPQQREQLVNLVSTNFDALYGKISKSANGASIKSSVWKSIAVQLNAIGPKKDVQGWIRCFTGLKATTKEKLSAIRQNNNRNGQQNVELDGIHLQLHKMHHPDTLDGCQTIDELGFGKHSAPKTTATTTNECSLEKDANSVDSLGLNDLSNLNEIKNDFENLKNYVAGVRENGYRIDKNLIALLKKLDGDTTELDDKEFDFQQADNMDDFNDDPNGAAVQSESQSIAEEGACLDSSIPAVDGNIINYSDLDEDEQIALLMSGQLDNSDLLDPPEIMDLVVGGTAVGIEDMEMDIEINSSSAKQVDNGQTRALHANQGSFNGAKIVILEDVLISNVCQGPSKQIETNIQVPTIPAISPAQPGEHSDTKQKKSNETISDDELVHPGPSKQIETSIQVPPLVVGTTQPANPSFNAPTQGQPQRRGVEINLHKFADSHQEPVVASKEKVHKPRRNRLSTPLGVMAQRALDEQVKTNTLLAEILQELRGKKQKLLN